MMMKRMILVIAVLGMMMGKSFGSDYDVIPRYTIILSVPNVCIDGINVLKICQRKSNLKVISIIGIVTGTFQTLFGVGVIEPEIQSWRFRYGIANIGIGSTTLILSVCNLMQNKKPQDTRISWNIYSFPAHDKSMGMGVSYSLRF